MPIAITPILPVEDTWYGGVEIETCRCRSDTGARASQDGTVWTDD